MNKCILKILFVCVLFISTLHANMALEFRTGAFLPSDHRFRDIYGDAKVCYEVEASTDLCGDIDMWTNFNFFTADGHVRNCGSSRIHIYSIAVGPKMDFCLTECVNLYAGIGLSVASTKIKNHSCNKESVTKASWGGVLKSGFNIALYECVFLDLFADYVYQPVSYHRRTNVGGFRLGAGIGAKF